jgi:hypothetical protein
VSRSCFAKSFSKTDSASQVNPLHQHSHSWSWHSHNHNRDKRTLSMSSIELQADFGGTVGTTVRTTWASFAAFGSQRSEVRIGECTHTAIRNCRWETRRSSHGHSLHP